MISQTWELIKTIRFLFVGSVTLFDSSIRVVSTLYILIMTALLEYLNLSKEFLPCGQRQGHTV